MSQLALATDAVLPDEPCYGLYELNFPAPFTGKGHRFQIIQVMRGEGVVEHRRDLGEASRFARIPQFRIPGGLYDEHGKFDVVETVGRLQEVADEMRVSREVPPVSDLNAAYQNIIQQKKDRRNGKVAFAITHRW